VSAAAEHSVDLVIVTGMSGSGKSTAIHALEDRGHYCIDNLPTALVSRFVDLCTGARDQLSKVALGLDLRDPAYVRNWEEVRREIEDRGHRIFVVFLNATDEVLIRRFSETRRRHPLGDGRNLSEAIVAEREALEPLRETADLVLDTTELTVHDLKRGMANAVPESGSAEAGLAITIKSFGFKHGPPRDADIILDVRFLPNPHFVEELRPHTGFDAQVADFVLDRDVTREFLQKIEALLMFLVPHYETEGKAYMTVGIGCTGGRHRSVALALELGSRLRTAGVPVATHHRDVQRIEP
jgi:UPF0042 nucleotide-binding protein